MKQNSKRRERDACRARWCEGGAASINAKADDSEGSSQGGDVPRLVMEVNQAVGVYVICRGPSHRRDVWLPRQFQRALKLPVHPDFRAGNRADSHELCARGPRIKEIGDGKNVTLEAHYVCSRVSKAAVILVDAPCQVACDKILQRRTVC